jgi:hypothetical protein
MNIELEDTKTLKEWLEIFKRPENSARFTLPGVSYGFYDIFRELLRREREDEITEDWKNGDLS